MERMIASIILVASIGFVLSPVLSPGFSGFTPEQFPIPQYHPPIQPAGYAFSIWGLIYLWLIVGAGYGLFKRAEATDWRRMRPALLLSLVIGIAWIPVANLSPLWATGMIWVMWGSAVMALINAGTQDRLWQRTPVALYAGWLTAASAVATGLVLAGYGILGAQSAAYLMLGLALVLGLFVQSQRPDSPEYALAIIWALAGIVVANMLSGNVQIIGLASLGILMLAGRAFLAR